MRNTTEAEFQSGSVRELVDGNRGYIIWKGAQYPAVTLPLRGGSASVALVAAINIANPDLRTVTLSPADFPNGLPAEEDTLTISEEGPNVPYQVITSNDQAVGLTMHTVTLIVFRLPPLNAATAPGGVRPSFRPPDIPQT